MPRAAISSMTACQTEIKPVERFMCAAAGGALMLRAFREHDLRRMFCFAIGAGLLGHAFAGSRHSKPPADPLDPRWKADAKIDFMSEQSFPASDAPAF